MLLLYIALILWEFGYRHRAFRSNLLSKKRSKGFPLQSLTQNHLGIVNLCIFDICTFLVSLLVKKGPSVMPL